MSTLFNCLLLVDGPISHFVGGDISYDEMVILMSSALSAMIRFNNTALGLSEEDRTETPNDAQMEKITDEAFLDADANMNGTIHKQEFVDWVKTKFGADDNMDVTVSDILLTFNLAKPKVNDDGDLDLEEGADGDQGGAIKSSREAWLTTKVDGIGEVATEYDLDKGIFTFTTGEGLSCTAPDDGFVQNKYLRKLAKMKAKKLKVLTVKASRNGKRAPTQQLTVSKKWEDQDDLSDYLQLVCLSLTEKEKTLRARKELLESKIADLE